MNQTVIRVIIDGAPWSAMHVRQVQSGLFRTYEKPNSRKVVWCQLKPEDVLTIIVPEKNNVWYKPPMIPRYAGWENSTT